MSIGLCYNKYYSTNLNRNNMYPEISSPALNPSNTFPAEVLLTWAVAAKRINSQHTMAHLKFTHKIVQENVTPEDIELAEQITRYYSKKIQVLILKGQKLTKFRQDLCKFLSMSSTDIPENTFLGMIYSLPFFYEYDQKIDQLFDQYSSLQGDTDNYGTQELNPITRIKVPHVSKHVYEYWFYKTNKKSNLPELVCTRVSKENSFRPMMDNIITSGKPLKVIFTKMYTMQEDKRKSYVNLQSFNLV